MHVFLTGSTGYVGGHLLHHLLAAGLEVSALVRPGSEAKLPVSEDSITILHGDATDPDSYTEELNNCDAAIHIIGVIREFPHRGINFEDAHVTATRNVVTAAADYNIQRFLYLSAVGTKHDSPSGYFSTKARAEDIVRESGLDYTIFRPSIMFGPDDEFINYFVDLMRTFHVIPLIGGARYRMQPVAIQDVCRVFIEALGAPETVGETYELAGPDRYEYKRMMKIVRRIAGTWAIPVHLPKQFMKGMAKLMQRFAFFPVTEDQITMLYDENITNDERIWELLGIERTGFEEGIAEYL